MKSPGPRLAFGAAVTLLIAIATGCTTLQVPQDGGGTVRVVEGGFVETVAFGNGPTFNIQINHEDVPEDEAGFPNVLTIGKYSRVIGSGFTKGADIYYRSRIDCTGDAAFTVADETYVVTWKCSRWRAKPGADPSIYWVTVERAVEPPLPGPDD